MHRRIAFLLCLALGVIALDQGVKYVVVRELTTRLDGIPTFGGRLKAFYSADPQEGFDVLHFRTKRFITVSENFLRIRYAENPGAAMGLFRNLPEHIRSPLFHLVSLGAVFFITKFYLKLTGAKNERWAAWGLSLVLGGAVGNYMDRLARGFVVDFLEAHWKEQWIHWPAAMNWRDTQLVWPSFNVADTAICVGVACLVIDSFVRRDRPADAGKT